MAAGPVPSSTTAEGFGRRIDSRRLYYVYRIMFQKRKRWRRGRAARFASEDDAGRFSGWVCRPRYADSTADQSIIWRVTAFRGGLGAMSRSRRPRSDSCRCGRLYRFTSTNAQFLAPSESLLRIDSTPLPPGSFLCFRFGCGFGGCPRSLIARARALWGSPSISRRATKRPTIRRPNGRGSDELDATTAPLTASYRK